MGDHCSGQSEGMSISKIATVGRESKRPCRNNAEVKMKRFVDKVVIM